MAREVELTDKLKKGTKLTPELVNIIKQFWHNQVFGAHGRQIPGEISINPAFVPEVGQTWGEYVTQFPIRLSATLRARGLSDARVSEHKKEFLDYLGIVEGEPVEWGPRDIFRGMAASTKGGKRDEASSLNLLGDIYVSGKDSDGNPYTSELGDIRFSDHFMPSNEHAGSVGRPTFHEIRNEVLDRDEAWEDSGIRRTSEAQASLDTRMAGSGLPQETGITQTTEDFPPKNLPRGITAHTRIVGGKKEAYLKLSLEDLGMSEIQLSEAMAGGNLTIASDLQDWMADYMGIRPAQIVSMLTMEPHGMQTGKGLYLRVDEKPKSTSEDILEVRKKAYQMYGADYGISIDDWLYGDPATGMAPVYTQFENQPHGYSFKPSRLGGFEFTQVKPQDAEAAPLTAEGFRPQYEDEGRPGAPPENIVETAGGFFYQTSAGNWEFQEGGTPESAAAMRRAEAPGAPTIVDLSLIHI